MADDRRPPATPRAVSGGLVGLARRAIVALAIAFVPQGIWSALIVWNLRTNPTIPWAVIAVAVAILLVARSLFRHRDASTGSPPARRPLRANAVPWPLLRLAWLAGGFAVVALVGVWTIFASFVRMPGSVLPDLSAYPPWTRVLAIATGAAVSPLCEQLGFWGYWQETLERDFSDVTAVLITAVAFAVLPHPPAHAAVWAKWPFFFLTGLTFSTMAYLTDSMLPGVVVHAGALLTFFVLVWPHDPQRPLVMEAGPDAWFWLHVAQAVVFTILAGWAFRQLFRVSHARRWAA